LQEIKNHVTSFVWTGLLLLWFAVKAAGTCIMSFWKVWGRPRYTIVNQRHFVIPQNVGARPWGSSSASLLTQEAYVCNLGAVLTPHPTAQLLICKVVWQWRTGQSDSTATCLQIRHRK
jgi:hypothetical protein